MGLTVILEWFSGCLVVVHYPLCLGPLSFGGGSFRFTRVQGERRVLSYYSY